MYNLHRALILHHLKTTLIRPLHAFVRCGLRCCQPIILLYFSLPNYLLPFLKLHYLQHSSTIWTIPRLLPFQCNFISCYHTTNMIMLHWFIMMNLQLLLMSISYFTFWEGSYCLGGHSFSFYIKLPFSSENLCPVFHGYFILQRGLFLDLFPFRFLSSSTFVFLHFLLIRFQVWEVDRSRVKPPKVNSSLLPLLLYYRIR